AGRRLLAGAAEGREQRIGPAAVGGDGVEGGDRLLMLAVGRQFERGKEPVAGGGGLAPLPPFPRLVAADADDDQHGERDDIGAETVPQPLVLLAAEVFVDFAEDI